VRLLVSQEELCSMESVINPKLTFIWVGVEWRPISNQECTPLVEMVTNVKISSNS
jgi:hypothetical protein